LPNTWQKSDALTKLAPSLGEIIIGEAGAG